MASAWLSAPRALSLDRTPSSCLRHDQQAARRVAPPFVLRRPGIAVVSAAAQKRLVAVGAATRMASAAGVGERPGKKTFMEEMRAAAMRLHSRDQSRHGEKEVPLEPPVATWDPTVGGFIRFLVDSKLVFDTLEAIVDRAAIPWA
nr:unnamed protein product [Digitaria exilis]